MAQINKPSEYFNTVLYTGNGSTQSITGVNFQPDLVWYKSRSNAFSSGLFDVIRGTSKQLYSNETSSEGTYSGVTSFDSDGFSLGSDAGGNQSSATYVAWNWLANGAGVSNTDGSITSTVSASTTSGFSIVTYTGNSTAGATIGHGLGVAPEIVFYKSTTGAFDWLVYSKALGATKELVLNSTAAGTTSTVFNDTDPTSTNLIVNTNAGNNSSSHSYVAYCFAEKKGFSKFGSYTGNGNADGTFVYTGFKPAFIIVKKYNATEDWFMYDNKRGGFNPDNFRLKANATSAEDPLSTGQIDLLSNGWKFRNSGTQYNASGDNYIYMAFAEQPLVGTNNIPACAR